MIPEQLLQTKLQTPRRRTPAVARPRLITRLNDGLNSRLILVSAPAGFGKTSLLTEWLAESSYPSTWLSLDQNDNRPPLFLAYFIAALQKVRPSLGEDVIGLVNSPEPFDIGTVLVPLMNEIGSVPAHFIVVVDDYHIVENTSIHKALSFLIDNLPPNMHLVIAGRADPPVNLARLRGRGQLTELRADDLRFKHDEIAEFLNRVMGLDLSKEDLALLSERSEGWIAGLQMAALTLKGKTDTAGFIKALYTTRRDILDYLFEEVFAQQAPDVRSFLLQTSILERLSPPLCDAVTERKDSAQILDRVEKANLFTFPFDDEFRSYHYHPLFKDLLRHTLGNTQPEMIPVLHRRASEWYERESLFALAITHALETRDYDRAAHLIERRAGEIFGQGELGTYLAWMESFPESIIQAYPILVIHRILAETLVTGMPLEDIEARLQAIEKLDLQNGLVKGAALVVRAVALGNEANLSRNPELCRQALELIPPESTFWHGLATLGLRQYWLLQGGVPAVPTAVSLYSEATEVGQRIGNLFARVVAQRRLAEAYVAGGRLRQAQSCYQTILDSAVDARGELLPIATLGLFGLGTLYREWNDLEKARSYLERGIALESGKLGRWQMDGVVELARTGQAQGDLEGASGYLRKARQLLNRFPRYRHEPVIAAHEVRLALARANMEKVNAWVKELNPTDLADSISIEAEVPTYLPRYPARELEVTTLARAYNALNRPAEALKLLGVLSKSAERLGRAGVVLEANILCSVAYKALGDHGKAMDHLKQALLAAEPEGYMRLFLDEGPAMAGLLYEAAHHGVTPAYAHRLMAALPVAESVAGRPGKSVKMKIEEPLSDRELDVLRLLAEGLSNKEIGGRLYIETRTVKWHTGNIFGKLGVKSRTQAAAKARELGVLKEDSN